MERSLTFYFHFNKPASKAAGKPQLSIHFQKKCLIVDNLVCNLPVRGCIRKTQPHFVMKGKMKPSDLRIEDGIAYLK
jgi:hypothetical protein